LDLDEYKCVYKCKEGYAPNENRQCIEFIPDPDKDDDGMKKEKKKKASVVEFLTITVSVLLIILVLFVTICVNVIRVCFIIDVYRFL
jgi:hypothetical protein